MAGCGMATIHDTTLVPSKLDLLADWLPRQSWYVGGPAPSLTRVGGFRLDDPAGEVGIQCLVVADRAGDRETTYFVPLSYRGAPLAGAEEGLVGTSEHGVLGTRWFYDGARDPVAVAQLLALVAGDAEAQHQDVSDAPDPSVGRTWSGGARGGPFSLDVVRVLRPGAATNGLGSIEADWRRLDGRTARGTVAVVR